MTDEEYTQIIDKINFEEKWLLDLYAKQYKVSANDIHIAMSSIRSIIQIPGGEINEFWEQEDKDNLYINENIYKELINTQELIFKIMPLIYDINTRVKCIEAGKKEESDVLPNS